MGAFRPAVPQESVVHPRCQCCLSDNSSRKNSPRRSARCRGLRASFTSTVRTSTGCSRKILSTPICWAESPLFLTVIFLKSCLQTFANGGIMPAGDTVGRTGALRSVRGPGSYQCCDSRESYNTIISFLTPWRSVICHSGDAIARRVPVVYDGCCNYICNSHVDESHRRKTMVCAYHLRAVSMSLHAFRGHFI